MRNNNKDDMKVLHTYCCRRTAALLVCPLLLLAAGFGCGNADRDDAEAAALAFAQAYFNYNFDEAAKFCTQDSHRWLAFAASNVYGADIEVLRNMDTGATVNVADMDFSDGDSAAVATVEVFGFMQRDTIGRAGRVVEEGVFTLSLVRSGGQWKVRMAGLPRNGK